MANYQTIVRVRPEVRDFIRHRRWVHRGDIVTYGPNIHCPAFSTDPRGFRHSEFKGRTYSVLDCLAQERYGIVLGRSNVYAFGVAGNRNTIPSVLAEQFGFPFANVGLPEGNSRNLYSVLVAALARAPRKPDVVLHLSGGDFTNFCYTSIADDIFGSPNLKQMSLVRDEYEGQAPLPDIRSLLAFSSLWIQAIAELCGARNIPLVLGEDVTFFEKKEASDLDRICELGKPLAGQEDQFVRHRKFVHAYHAMRSNVAMHLGLPLCGPGFDNDVSFVDEFHYDSDGVRLLCDHFAKGIEASL